MYKKIEVWKKIGSKLIRFHCIKRFDDGRFAVQNADYFSLPIETSSVGISDRRFVELFLDAEPAERCDWFASLEEAVKQHEADFADMPGAI